MAAGATSRLAAEGATPVDLVRDSLDRMDAWEPRLRSLVLRLDGQALAEAERLTQELRDGFDRGPLHGIPIVVKDHIDVAGTPSTAGSRILADNVAESDAPAVARLRDAGAVVVGKANTHELAFGATTPPTRNPWDLDRIPGGSSGGSGAAVGAGLVPLALGTDSGASVREPAALCGCVGLKPTLGRVSRRGCVPFAWTMDTIGPMATTTEACAALLSVIEGPDANDPGSNWAAAPERHVPPVDELRVGVVAELMQPLQPDVAAAVDGVLGALPGVREISLGHPDDWLAAILIIVQSEAFVYQREWVSDKRSYYSPEVLAQVELGATYTAADYIDAQRVRYDLSRRVARVLAEVDVLVAPAALVVAPRVGEETVSFPGGVDLPLTPTLVRPLAPFALSGHPAASVPIAHGRETNLPVGLQVVGPAHADHWLLAVAAEIQRCGNWDPSPPPFPEISGHQPEGRAT